VVVGSVAGTGHELSLGGELRRSSMDYDSWKLESPADGLWNEFVPVFDDQFASDVATFWLEDQVTLASERLGLRFGLRGTSPEGLDTSLDPRLGLRFALTDWLALTAGAGRYTQSVHSVRVEESIATSFMAFDLFRPAQRSLGMPRAEDVVLGAELRLGDASLRADVYTKRYSQLSLPALPPNPWHAEAVELDGFHPGTAAARGAEVLADYVREPVGFWLSYAWQKTLRTVRDVTYTPRYERRHTLDVLTAFSLPDGVQLNVRGIYGSGQPTTPVIGWQRPPRFAPQTDLFDVRAERRNLLGVHNSIRLPAYIRVDIGARFHMEREILERTTSLDFFAQLVNALNITNTLYWDPSIDSSIRDDPKWQFGPTLTAGLEWSF
jgi:hypothetical protein